MGHGVGQIFPTKEKGAGFCSNPLISFGVTNGIKYFVQYIDIVGIVELERKSTHKYTHKFEKSWKTVLHLGGQ